MRNVRGQSSLWAHGISGDLPILLVRVMEEDDLALVRQVLQAQEYWRLKGLRADVVIINEHPITYLDEMQEHLSALIERGAWGAWRDKPGGVFLLRGDGLGEADHALLSAVARGRPRGQPRRAVAAAGPAVTDAGRAAWSGHCRRSGPRPATPRSWSRRLSAWPTASADSPPMAGST